MSEGAKSESKAETPLEDFPYVARSSWEIIYQGAEAKVWRVPKSDAHDAMVCKERFAKSYRHPALDERLTKSRCKAEAKALEKCLKSDGKVRAPKLIRMEPPLLYVEFLSGPTVKQHLSGGTLKDEKAIAFLIGETIGRLHDLGLIHGDLTTSNMILTKLSDEGDATNEDSNELALIDFGLAKGTTSAEEQAVDMYVLERALLSAHPELQNSFFSLVLESYSKARGTSKFSKNTLQRLEQVRQRGRKRECFG